MLCGMQDHPGGYQADSKVTENVLGSDLWNAAQASIPALCYPAAADLSSALTATLCSHELQPVLPGRICLVHDTLLPAASRCCTQPADTLFSAPLNISIAAFKQHNESQIPMLASCLKNASIEDTFSTAMPCILSRCRVCYVC